MICEQCGQGYLSRVRQISRLSEGQEAGVFFHFDLEDGGRVHIPPDQVMRMWNEEQRRLPKTSPGLASREECGNTTDRFQGGRRS